MDSVSERARKKGAEDAGDQDPKKGSRVLGTKSLSPSGNRAIARSGMGMPEVVEVGPAVIEVEARHTAVLRDGPSVVVVALPQEVNALIDESGEPLFGNATLLALDEGLAAVAGCLSLELRAPLGLDDEDPIRGLDTFEVPALVRIGVADNAACFGEEHSPKTVVYHCHSVEADGREIRAPPEGGNSSSQLVAIQPLVNLGLCGRADLDEAISLETKQLFEVRRHGQHGWRKLRARRYDSLGCGHGFRASSRRIAAMVTLLNLAKHLI